jgi:L-fuconolactonase
MLAALTGARSLVGVRHQALAEADPAGWLCLPAVQRGLADLEHAGLPFDLIIRPEHFPAAVALARAHSSLQLVLNHLGKPPIRSGELEPWATGLRQLADLPNLSCKLSGVQTIAAPGWMYPDLAPFLDLVLTSFGPDRILFGSDWPVCTRAASYVEVVEVARKACVNLTPAEQAAVFGENARRIYRMPRRPLP